MRRLSTAWVFVSVLAGFVTPAGAQPEDVPDEPEASYELALSGSSVVRSARTARFRGVSYRVEEIAELVPWSGRVRARYRTDTSAEPWVDVQSDGRGRFELALPIAQSGEGSRIEVEVGPDGAARSFELPVTVQTPWRLHLRTDRVLYEPGEPVHVWLRVADATSGAPAAGRRVRFAIQGSGVEREPVVTTTEGGVAHVTFRLAAAQPEGVVTVDASVDDTAASTSFRIGQRTWERLFATATVEPDEIAPGGTATVVVTVTTPDTTPVRGATVRVQLGDLIAETAVTGEDGRATLQLHAPAFLEGEVGSAGLQIEVTHPAHGSLRTSAALTLAVPLAMEIEAIPAHGALAPEIDDVIFVRLHDVNGRPPPAGTEVEARGAAFAGGRGLATTDANGIAQLPVRLPRGASAGGEEPQTTIRVSIRGGPLERLARISVPVMEGVDVLPTVARPIAEPGATIDIRLSRRPSAARSPVVLDLLDESGIPLAFAFAAPGATTTRLTVPAGKLGRMRVRARAIREGESLEGAGGSDQLIVRPAAPDFVQLTAARERWRVGETAQIVLQTRAGAPRAWAALLVRDLAAHGGEQNFAEHFLSGAFDRALLEAATEESERLVRAALAAAAVDPEPPVAAPLLDALGLPVEESSAAESSVERGALRDPWPLARELERRGIGAAMVELEQAIADALDGDTLDEITVVAGGRRRFRSDLLESSETRTLGGGTITPAMLEAVDRSFGYDAAARRVARVRLIQILASLALYLDPGDEASLAARTAAREPWPRWLARMVERGVIPDELLDDPWGSRFVLRAAARPAIALSPQAVGVELVSPGPDRRLGTADDFRDPFARAVTAGTTYAVASGEDALMRQLAVLSAVERTLAAIREAYARINAEVTEDEIGDAVRAEVSEGTIGLGNLGTIGHGAGGGGSGSGYGRGAGGISGRGSRTPRAQLGGGNLARLVRERFPPTILFRPEIAVSATGTTPLEVRLADAVTSYRCEVIVWREDGWVWSARTEIASDRDVVIDAPIPEVARAGDRLILPVRVQNRGTDERTIAVSLLGDRSLGIPDVAARRVRVPAGAAVQTPIEIALARRGSGSLRVVAQDPNGAPLDAVRRPIRVVAPSRRVRATQQTLIERRGELTIEVEQGADPREGTVHIAVGAALFEGPGDEVWSAWAEPHRQLDVHVDMRSSAAVAAFAIGALWSRSAISDEAVRAATETLVRTLESGRNRRDQAFEPRTDLAERAWVLLGLAPVARDLDARPALRADTVALIERLTREVTERAIALEEEPELTALAAAAIGWSGGARARPRVAELVRRLRRSIVEVGDDVWLATADRPVRATVLLAMAEVALGRRGRAFALLATVARWRTLGHVLEGDEAALARAAAQRLGEGRAPERVELVVDGRRRTVALDAGRAELNLPVLARSGRHTVAVALDDVGPVHLSASVLYGVAWDQAPERAGPFAIALEGDAGARDGTSGLTLVVRNRSPRWIAAPIVQIEVPTGAELPEREHALLRAAVRRSDFSAGTLALTLRALPPGAEARVPLPLRWSVAGTLEGLGVAAWAGDRPDAISVRAPAPLRIAEAPGGER